MWIEMGPAFVVSYPMYDIRRNKNGDAKKKCNQLTQCECNMVYVVCYPHILQREEAKEKLKRYT